ncbi:mannitol dehydrogenase family protein [Pelosinus baikalensis]|uniref:Mannitol dehydrogenase family protein n=1 Tax=Pelosinus baikalensis TaxID=2892015 RepID=A0ABS8HYB1_9FIRM|nr:mannitol dehydrogenase family protein [Pelosinus baikalensis]MCC5467228.1 mannitol dehydrogenase family protein [Pelosinus baikalensis]
MLVLNKESIKNTSLWEQAGIENLKFNHEKMTALTKENPTWVHFGAGNIFRGFIAMLQQSLLNSGTVDSGIVVVETYDSEIIDEIYTPYDNLGLLAIMNTDGSLDKKIIGSIGESLVGDPSRANDWQRIQTIFSKPSLQLASFTITEKGYSLKNAAGNYSADVQEDMNKGPENPKSVMAKIASLAYTRYQHGELRIAFVSMDNCSHNGDKLYSAVEAICRKWVELGLVEEGFLNYINTPEKVSFPWSMIDKITPRPAESVKNTLNQSGFGSTDILCTTKNTFIAPFVNAEKPQYLVIEDKFPNGRMPLEHVGVIFTDRQTVDRVEKMKVCTCLNPLHTSLAVFGCLLGYTLIADEMKDPILKKLVEKIGYEEGMPVVINPQIVDPKAFIKEVIEVRFPNPYIPDTPQRIASDTSQKVAIRFGETIKAYSERADLDPASLTFIPLVIAGWCRYLMGLDDQDNEMSLSSDPLLSTLTAYISGIKIGDVESVGDSLQPILSNEEIFGVNLYSVGLGEKIEGYFKEMISGSGAVKATLQKHLKN